MNKVKKKNPSPYEELMIIELIQFSYSTKCENVFGGEVYKGKWNLFNL